ncbi:MAG: flagellar hook protein FlgE [Gammaproteobacteria bacterium]|nr:flagellar hook protein FlgE [Gammaproteobacteria bacterium]
MSFDIALSGLNAASTELEVISNNIANNSTAGFKSSRVEFSDVYASTSANDTGQGVGISSIRQSFVNGNYRDTGKDLDMSITGQGFFQLQKEGDINYSRNGTFGLDREGYVINAEEYNLMGYPADDDGFLAPTVGPLRINPNDLAPHQTEDVIFGLNLDSTLDILPPFDVNTPDTYNFTTATTIYDSLGSPSVMTIYFHKDTPNTWSMYTFVEDQEVSQPGGDELVFNTEGGLQTMNGTTNHILTMPTFTPTTGGSPMSVDIDATNITQYNGDAGVNQISQDGFSNGRLKDIRVDEDGTILGQYSNGQTQVMGQVALTNFSNIDGLQQVWGTSWRETYASGAALTGAPGSASLGNIRAGALEESNVDITAELVAMISAQRSFQANAQVITTADTINQTVISMRR